MQCPQCHVENKDSAKSCRKCGYDLQLPPLWKPTWQWHGRVLFIIYVTLTVIFFIAKVMLKPYVRQLPSEITPWMHSKNQSSSEGGTVAHF